MTLYYSLVFAVLCSEMVLFLGLILPLPFTWRRKLFSFISESPIVAKFQYGMKITFIFILILFVDSVNRTYRVYIELSAFSKSEARGGTTIMGGTERMEVQARKFYSQRNMYLCGFTLFLSLILNRTYVMIQDLLRSEEQIKLLRGDGKAKGNDGEVARLKDALAKKDRDMDNLKKQTQNMSTEYMRMGDQVSAVDKTPKKDK